MKVVGEGGWVELKIENENSISRELDEGVFQTKRDAREQDDSEART